MPPASKLDVDTIRTSVVLPQAMSTASRERKYIRRWAANMSKNLRFMWAVKTLTIAQFRAQYPKAT